MTPVSFLSGVRDSKRHADALELLGIFQRATGEEPVMWGSSIVGFGKYHYRYESGREGDMCLAGFSPRSSAFAIYALSGAKGEADLLARLGKYERGKGCLYVKRLEDIDPKVLEGLVRLSADHTREKQQCDVCVERRATAKSASKAKKTAKKTVKKAAAKRASRA